MRGTYRFYQNGELIGKSENLITDAGKRHILRYLAGQEASLAGSMAVGTGTADPLGTDSRLTYEFDRSTINLISPSYIDKKIIFKTTLNKEVVGTIYEVGLFSTSYGSTSRSLASFEEFIEAWTAGTYATGNQRVGTQALRITAAANGTVTSVLPSASIDLSAYANTDRIVIAFYCVDSNNSSVRLRLRGPDPATYFEASIAAPMQGYNVRSFTKGSLIRVGSVGFEEIDSLELAVSAKATGGTTVDFDGIRVEAFSPDIENILVSRSLLPQPKQKTDEAEMDIEYHLEVNI